jgi:Leu/Phe-tRNA-protein transferase
MKKLVARREANNLFPMHRENQVMVWIGHESRKLIRFDRAIENNGVVKQVHRGLIQG